mgnify:CR=1 FL=1
MAPAAKLFLGVVAATIDGEDLEEADRDPLSPGGEKRASLWMERRKHKKEGEVSLPLDLRGIDGLDLRSVGCLDQPITAQLCPHAGSHFGWKL